MEKFSIQHPPPNNSPQIISFFGDLKHHATFQENPFWDKCKQIRGSRNGYVQLALSMCYSLWVCEGGEME